MLIISCWLVAGASGMSLGQSQSEMIADICEENQSLGCIPAALVEHLGRPMSRLQVASRYLISTQQNLREKREISDSKSKLVKKTNQRENVAFSRMMMIQIIRG